jgi:hypothetical protein
MYPHFRNIVIICRFFGQREALIVRSVAERQIQINIDLA